MGACSSPPLRHRRHSQQTKRTPSRNEYQKNSFRNADSVGKGSEATTANKATYKEGVEENSMSSALAAVGEILFFDKRGSSEGEWQVLGVGCMISPRILLASDHYLHLYSPQQLAFRSLKRKSITRMKQCLYPPASMLPKDKKKSTYLHKRVSPALFLIDEAFPCEDFMELGTGVLTEQAENNQFQCMQLKEKIIEQTSRNLYFYTTKSTPERGWPLLYQLYGTFYCVGLYSFPQVSDSMLWSENMVQRFKSCEGKHCGTEYINSVEISEALVQMKVVPCSGDKLEDLLMELQQSTNKSQQEKAEATFRLGIYYGSLGNYTKQKQYYLIALNLYLNCYHPHPIHSIAALYHNLGICLSEIGDNLQARNYLQKSLRLKLEEEDQDYGETVADTYNQLGVVCKKEGRSQQALKYYTKAYNIYNQLNYFEKMSIVLNNITLLSQESQTHSSNETKYLGILTILHKTKGENCIQMAEVLFNLAKIQSQCKNYGTAISYLSKAVNVMKNLRLQQHSHYKMMVQVIQEIDTKVKQSNEKREWLLKSTALMQML